MSATSSTTSSPANAADAIRALPGVGRSVKIVVDCRYTRHRAPRRHQPVRRAPGRGARAARHARRARGDDADQRRGAARACCPTCRGRWRPGPTSAREPWVALQVNRLQPDVVFTPMQTMGGAGPPVRARQDAARPDLLPQPHAAARSATPPSGCSGACTTWPGGRSALLLNQADAVATISQTSKALIEQHRLTKRPARRSCATPPIPVAGTAAARDRPVTRDLLYMGSFMPYKNVETLALAMHVLPGYRLHLLSKIGPADRARLLDLAPAGALDAAQRRQRRTSTPSCSGRRSRSCTRRSTRASASR